MNHGSYIFPAYVHCTPVGNTPPLPQWYVESTQQPEGPVGDDPGISLINLYLVTGNTTSAPRLLQGITTLIEEFVQAHLDVSRFLAQSSSDLTSL
jgi:hypothetical protein